MSTPSKLSEALREVRKAIESTSVDFASIPFFVRPMVKRGFTRRTGRSLEQWQEHLARAIRAAEAGGPANEMLADLERLAESYRTDPERAQRAMKGAVLETVKARSLERERTVRAAIEVLRGS